MNETQELMLEISRKERALASARAPRPLRLHWMLLVAPGIGNLALVVAILCGVAGSHREELRVPSALRSIAQAAPEVPWRHFRGGDCNVWVSDAGLAEVFCGGRVVYRGFGRVEEGRFSALPLYESTPYDHDLARTAWLDGRDAWVGSFAHCHAGIACGRFELHGLAR